MLCKNSKWLTFKPNIGHKEPIIKSYKKYTDLELFFSINIIIGVCIVPYFLFISFENEK